MADAEAGNPHGVTPRPVRIRMSARGDRRPDGVLRLSAKGEPEARAAVLPVTPPAMNVIPRAAGVRPFDRAGAAITAGAAPAVRTAGCTRGGAARGSAPRSTEQGGTGEAAPRRRRPRPTDPGRQPHQ